MLIAASSRSSRFNWRGNILSLQCRVRIPMSSEFVLRPTYFGEEGLARPRSDVSQLQKASGVFRILTGRGW